MEQQTTFRKGYAGGEFLTATYRVSGEIDIRGDPLYDQLNAHHSLYVQLERMFISLLLDPAVLAGNYPYGQVRKNGLALVVLAQRKAGLPLRAGKYTARDNVNRSVLFVVSGIEVRGLLRLHPSVNVAHFVRTTPEDFIPIFDATATLTARREIVFQGGAILLNRNQVEVFALDEKSDAGI